MALKVLCDFHHGDLLESLRILFEDRLGAEFYRPIGLEWHTEHYWKVWDAVDTARQYLALELSEEYERLRPIWLNGKNEEVANGIFHIPDPNHGHTYRAMTLPAAKEVKWDIIISSMPQHFEPMERFRRFYCTNAKHIFQMGNAWSLPDGCLNLLNSTSNPLPLDINAVRYHQEFSLKEFTPEPPIRYDSLCNLMHYQEHHHLKDFKQLKSHMHGWAIQNFGAGNEDGPVLAGQMGKMINAYAFIFHCKRGGEGYGYNIHNSYACGRPMVVRKSLYAGTISEPLMTDGQTCIDIDQWGIDGAAEQLKRAAVNWQDWSDRAYARFKSVVNFDAEFEQIKSFLEKLK